VLFPYLLPNTIRILYTVNKPDQPIVIRTRFWLIDCECTIFPEKNR
jgi:hypothetical protein